MLPEKNETTLPPSSHDCGTSHRTARGQRVEEGAVDLVNQGAEVALEDAVQLERLARSELERAVGVRAGG